MLSPAILVGQALAAARETTSRTPPPTLGWAATQLVPSPGALVAGGRVSFTLALHVTPLLFSFGTHARQPWRFFVVPPLHREGGSIGVVAGPEVLFDRPGSPWAGRFGFATHLPWGEAGDTRSTSIGISYLRQDERGSAWGEIGAHTLFGVVGLVVRASPRFQGGRAAAIELRIRYF